MIGEELASDTTLDQVLCICSGRRLEETCTEGLTYKSLGCGMVTAESGVNFCQKIPPFHFGDAPSKDSGSTFLIKLSLMDLVGFRTPHNAACLILVLREFLPI